MSIAPFTITVAGRRLTVLGDSSGLDAVAAGFAGVADVQSDAAEAVLELETVADPAGEGFWRAREIGAHRAPDGALAVVSRAPSFVETYLPGPVPRLHLAASPDAWASGEVRGHPANQAIASWLASSSVQVVHGAAVAYRGRGALLVGVGGRGKSTTALACAQAGFAYLGDDLCVVEAGSTARGDGPRVHGMYTTAKLNPDSRGRLGAHDWPVLGTTPTGKDVVGLPPRIRFERSMPLVAVVAVRVDADSEATVRRVSRSSAVGLLCATGLPMAIGSGTPAQWLRVVASIARQVPVYELPLAWDLDRVVADLRSIVERGAPSGSR